MRVYEGAPRQNYQEVLRSLGALLDQRGMREILLTEVAEGFIVQGLAPVAGHSAWGEGGARLDKETLTFVDDDIARVMDEDHGRRREAEAGDDVENAPKEGFYEQAMRVIGAYIDQQKPRDIFFLEQDHAFVLRLLMLGSAGTSHVLAEFTREDIEGMIEAARAARLQESPAQ